MAGNSGFGGAGSFGGVTPAAQIPLAAVGSSIAEEINLNVSGWRVILPCADKEWASVQTAVIASTYSSAVLTIKGTLNGENYVTLGEPTISADGIYGPLYVAGLVRVCLEVTTVAGADRLCRITWRGWGKIQ